MISTVTKIAQNLSDEFKKADSRKQYWKSELKPWLIDVLKGFGQQPHDLSSYVQPNITDEFEYVHFVIEGQRETGNPKQFRGNAVLGYQLTHRGKVLVFIQRPFVKGEQVENDLLETIVVNNASYEPKELADVNVIFNHIEEFLQTLFKWETSGSSPLGFQIAQTEQPVKKK